MKKVVFVCFWLIIILSLSACKSKEDKAADLIRLSLSKTLYDFDSYEPIETTVKEAHLTAYNDTTCFRLALSVSISMKKAKDALDEANDAIEYMNIWGPPTHYSSSYSDKKYYKYRDKAKEKHKEAQTYIMISKTIGTSLEDSIQVLDNNKIIGWEVRHRFRCKTRGGHNAIGDYRYIIDKDFKNIVFEEDMDNEDYSKAREAIKDAENRVFSALDID